MYFQIKKPWRKWNAKSLTKASLASIKTLVGEEYKFTLDVLSKHLQIFFFNDMKRKGMRKMMIATRRMPLRY